MSTVITTPTGHIGSALVRHLLDPSPGSGQAARRDDLVLLVRDASKLPADVRDRVETREGDLRDAAYVRDATAGADALFWLTPNDWAAPDLFGFYAEIAEVVTRAVRENGIGRVVHLSSEGAQNHDDHGPVSGLGRVEAALDATGAAVRHLRPTFFQENFEAQIPAIRDAGAVFFPAPPDTRTGMIATRDIAAAAAHLLLDDAWAGTEVVPLHGPRDLSYAEAAAVLSDGLGRTVVARQVPTDALRQQFLGMGASSSFVDGLVALYPRIGTPGYSGDPRTETSTTPTELSTYVTDTLRPMVEAASAG